MWKRLSRRRKRSSWKKKFVSFFAKGGPKMNETHVLEKLNQYENKALTSLFVTRLKMKNVDHANENLKELKKLLYLIYLVQDRKTDVLKFDVLEQMSDLDEMWHQFILMTRDYEAFCFEVFGTYLHHEPTIPNVPNSKTTPKSTDPEINQSLYSQVSLVAKTWGLETATRWYAPRSKFKRKIYSLMSLWR